MGVFSHCYVKMFAILATVFVHGCVSTRNSASPAVADIGPDVLTRYRYRLSRVYNGETAETIRLKDEFLAKYHPHVFSANGLPFALRIKFDRMDSAKTWTTIPCMCSIGVIPQHKRDTTTFNCSVEMADSVDGTVSFDLVSIQDRAEGNSPIAYLFYNGDASVEGHRVFSHNEWSSSMYYVPDPAKRMEIDEQFRQALAYGIAVKLKELEDSGKVDAMLRKQAEQRSAAPAHSIVQLTRDSDSGFSYTFAIDLAKTPADMKAAARAVLREFMKSVKEEYMDAFPNADAASLSVAFSNLKVEGRRIGGRAAVLTIKPLSLTYDANARRGKLSVRFNAGQADEARAWIRRNIKTLARDKNIALVTGRLPPEATFRTLGEKVDGDVMEIDFRTE